MNVLFHCIFIVIICKIQCQQTLIEGLAISQQNDGENINIKKTNIDRRFIEDLDDYEWHVAHLRGAVLDGRRDCIADTFADRARRYRKMLMEDGARVDFVSSKPLQVNPDDIVVETCKVKDDSFVNATMKVTSANFIEPTETQNESTINITSSTVNTTETTKTVDTTPKLDFKATTIQPKERLKGKKMGDQLQQEKNDTRRAGEYIFSSVEYYDESIEFDNELCPDAVEIIELQIDQLRSYDLECEMTVEWRSLE